MIRRPDGLEEMLAAQRKALKPLDRLLAAQRKALKPLDRLLAAQRKARVTFPPRGKT